MTKEEVAKDLNMARFGVCIPVVIVDAMVLLERTCLEFGEAAEAVEGFKGIGFRKATRDRWRWRVVSIGSKHQGFVGD